MTPDVVVTTRRTGPTVEPTPRRIRVRLDGHLIATSNRAQLLRRPRGEDERPTYFVPLDDVAPDALVDGHLTGDGRMRWTVVGGDRRASDAAWAFADPDGDLTPVAGHVSFEWDRVDWFEEDEQVLVHARDPYTRVDVLASSRLVVVVHGDVVLASSARPFVLFETYAPRRYYLPATDVRTELLEPSATVRHCPYVGVAHYWSARIGSRIVADIAWSYPDPLPEQVKVRDLICFAAEQVDVIVDGRRESVPDPSLRRRP